jgi:hypothetical protein
MKTQRIILFLLIAASLVATSCRGRTERTEGSVVLSVSHFNGLPISVSARSSDPTAFQIENLTLMSTFKDPTITTSLGHGLEAIDLRSYELTYRRRDTGTRVPPPAVLGIFGTVQPLAPFQIFNLPYLTTDQILSQPIKDLRDFGRDTETGSAVIVLDVTIRFFGRTLGGDEVSSNPATFTLEVTP